MLGTLDKLICFLLPPSASSPPPPASEYISSKSLTDMFCVTVGSYICTLMYAMYIFTYVGK